MFDRLREWFSRGPTPAEVYVITERGKPIGACVERDAAKVLAADVKRTDVRIHLVPFVAGD